MLYLLYTVGTLVAVMCEVAVVHKLDINKKAQVKAARMKKLEKSWKDLI